MNNAVTIGKMQYWFSQHEGATIFRRTAVFVNFSEILHLKVQYDMSAKQNEFFFSFALQSMRRCGII